jgi:hypothetical protein
MDGTYFNILCNLWVTSDTKCTILGYLITSEHQLYNVMPLETPFSLLIRLLQSSPTCNYNHLFHSYTFTQFTNTTL